MKKLIGSAKGLDQLEILIQKYFYSDYTIDRNTSLILKNGEPSLIMNSTYKIVYKSGRHRFERLKAI